VQHPAMTTRNKTWRDKRDAQKQPKRVRLEADFAGIKAGKPAKPKKAKKTNGKR
jgi:hypothetical protein